MAHSGWPTFVSAPANSTPHTARGAGRSKSTGAFFRYRIILRPLRCSRSGDPGGVHRHRYHSFAPQRVMGVTSITFPLAATACREADAARRTGRWNLSRSAELKGRISSQVSAPDRRLGRKRRRPELDRKVLSLWREHYAALFFRLGGRQEDLR